MGAFALHELSHLLAIYAVGGSGRLAVRPWRFALLPIAIAALHAQPAEELDPARQAVVNFAGPALAAVPLAAVGLRARSRGLRAALAGNLVVLGFYAVIEVADVGFDAAGAVEPAALLTPELNYGVPLVVLVVASWWGARTRRPGPAAIATG